MKCENCQKKEVDGIIMVGGITLKVCSPKCMSELLAKRKKGTDLKEKTK